MSGSRFDRLIRVSVLSVFLALFGLSSVSNAQFPGLPGAERIRFEVSVVKTDPFDLTHKIGAAHTNSVMARRGAVVTVRIKGTLGPGFHTYPVVKASKDQNDFMTSMELKAPEGFVALTGVRESEPKLVDVEGIGKIYEVKGEFIWEQDVLIKDAKPGNHKLTVQLNGQSCDDSGCLPFTKSLEVSVDVSDEAPLALNKDIENRIPKQTIAPSPPDRGKKNGAVSPVAEPTNSEQLISAETSSAYQAVMKSLEKRIIYQGSEEDQTGLFAFLLTGVIFGLLTLVTPCVFPMIPITVSFFLKQAEKENHNPLKTALVYCGTIVIVLTVAAVAFLGTFQALSFHPVTNVLIGGLFIFFALSLFGMYEIQLPSGLARLTSSKEGQGGLVGTVFMALTFTIISFACVAPFLGAFGGLQASGARPLWHIILGGLAFATTFAAPFFLLALFPALLKKLPKSGSWMNSVKVVMGFLELAAAFKFFRTAELAATSRPMFFTFDLVLGIWVALCLLCALYLIGVYRLSHDSPVEKIGAPRMLWAAAFLGLAFYLAPALFKVDAEGRSNRPGGDIYAWVDTFLLPAATSYGDGPSSETGNLEFAIAQMQKNQSIPGRPKRIFIDFTGKL